MTEVPRGRPDELAQTVGWLLEAHNALARQVATVAATNKMQARALEEQGEQLEAALEAVQGNPLEQEFWRRAEERRARFYVPGVSAGPPPKV